MLNCFFSRYSRGVRHPTSGGMPEESGTIGGIVVDVMPNWLEKRASLSPDRQALITENKIWTFSELHREAIKYANKLSALGVRAGDHVALLLGNKPEFVFLLHGIECIGAVAVLLNTRLTSYEIMWQANDSDAKLFIYGEEFLDKIDSSSFNEKIISTNKLEEISEILTPLRSEWRLHDLHTIIYTSGTTGKPKGVMLTYGNHWWSAVGSALNVGLHNQDSWLCALPLFHVGGLSILMRSIFYGIPVVLLEKFDPKLVIKMLDIHHVTIISVVSQMLIRMLEEVQNRRFSKSLRCVLLGGGPAPKPLLEKCRDKSIPVFQTYGMTETASQIVTLSPEYTLTKLGSAGKPLFPAQLRIEKDHQIQEEHQAGEIVVKGPNVAKGYWNREEESKKANVNGWFYTGDIGYLDEDGFLYVLDRRSDLIISGGENIYPAEVESVLLAHQSIDEAGVIGIEDEKWGQVPVAFVKTNSTFIDEDEIILFCQERLANYKIPVKIYFVENLPRNASNKLMRHKLKEML